jgi:hypothetical protein
MSAAGTVVTSVPLMRKCTVSPDLRTVSVFVMSAPPSAALIAGDGVQPITSIVSSPIRFFTR